MGWSTAGAHILVVAAGTGSDILELSKFDESWTYTAEDLCNDMLEIANKRFMAVDIVERVTSHVGEGQRLNYWRL